MVTLTGSVGDASTNAQHDVAVVQLMLRLIRNTKGAYYYSNAYNGTCDQATTQAIANFQKDKAIGLGVLERSGMLTANGPTLSQLNNALPAKYSDMRIISGASTVYVPASAGDAVHSGGIINAKTDLEPTFKQKIVGLVQAMYNTHKIALEVVGPGWRRTFAEQAAQAKTGAGPGESNHNFGRAVDLGFHQLTWINKDGAFVKEGGWLGSAALGATKSLQFWQARDAIALNQFGLFLTNFQGERVHLQSYADATANTRRSLAKLLSTVGSMKWTFHASQYQTDLGLGGKLVDVGTAKQIWTGAATVTAANVASAAAGKTLQLLASNSLFTKLSAVQAASNAPGNAAGALAAKDVTAADLTLIKAALKAEFEAADANWQKWAPVP